MTGRPAEPAQDGTIVWVEYTRAHEDRSGMVNCCYWRDDETATEIYWNHPLDGPSPRRRWYRVGAAPSECLTWRELLRIASGVQVLDRGRVLL